VVWPERPTWWNGPVTSIVVEPSGAEAAVAAVRASYDAVAAGYDAAMHDELDHKPLDRAVLQGFLDVVGDGVVADVGCGPGQVTGFLAARHRRVVGIDLAPLMLVVARKRRADLPVLAASMLQLPFADGALAGVAAMYSIIHLDSAGRSAACGELARVLRPGGHLLVAFHVDDADLSAGQVRHFDSWFEEAVDLDFHFLDPQDVIDDLATAGFEVTARMDREPHPGAEHPSRRCYLLAQRREG